MVDVMVHSTKRRRFWRIMLIIAACCAGALALTIAFRGLSSPTRHYMGGMLFDALRFAVPATLVAIVFFFLPLLLLDERQRRRYARRLRPADYRATARITSVDPQRGMPAEIILQDMPGGLPDLVLSADRTAPGQFTAHAI